MLNTERSVRVFRWALIVLGGDYAIYTKSLPVQPIFRLFMTVTGRILKLVLEDILCSKPLYIVPSAGRSVGVNGFQDAFAETTIEYM